MMLRLLAGLIVLFTGGLWSAIAPPATAQVEPLTLVLESPGLADDSCFRINGEGTLSEADLIAAFTAEPDAATELANLGWEAAAFRRFVCDAPPADGPSSITISVQVFATEDGARAAASYFAGVLIRSSKLMPSGGRLGLAGEISVGGPVDEGTQFGLFLPYSNRMYIITAISPTGDPAPAVQQVAASQLLVAAVKDGGSVGATSAPATASEPEVADEPAEAPAPVESAAAVVAEDPAAESPAADVAAAGAGYDVIDLGTMSGNVSWATLINNQNVVIWGGGARPRRWTRSSRW